MVNKIPIKNTLRFKARIGVLVPHTNSNLEPDLTLLAPADVGIHVTRIGGYDTEGVPGVDQMSHMGDASLEHPARLLKACRPDAILYGCTSATMVHGLEYDRDLTRRLTEIMGTSTFTASGALVIALSRLGVTDIDFASPYVQELNDRAVSFLNDAGFRVHGRADVNRQMDSYGQGMMQPKEIRSLALRANSDKSQALVLACTDMRAVELISQLEQDLGKPIVTTNQAMMFCALSELNLSHSKKDFGQLFKHLGKAYNSATL